MRETRSLVSGLYGVQIVTVDITIKNFQTFTYIFIPATTDIIQDTNDIIHCLHFCTGTRTL